MKTKFILLLFTVGFGILATGCCTGKLVAYSRARTVDRFFPTAVYQSTNNSGLAFEGNLHKQQWSPTSMYAVDTDSEPPVHCYLLIFQTNLLTKSFQTNNDFIVKEIKNLPIKIIKKAQITYKLSSDFRKIADLPKSDFNLILKKNYPHKVALVFLPFTVAADVALSPVYLIAFALFIMVGGWHC